MLDLMAAEIMDITPPRLSAIDVVSLTPREAYAVLIHLAGSTDAVVASAVVDATAFILARTRSGEADT
jgi:hypothetical protein